MEAQHPWGNRPQRRPARITPLRSDDLATMVRGQPATGPRAAPNAITAEAASKYEEDQKTIRGIVFPTIGCIV